MESSIAVFLSRQLACEQLPTNIPFQIMQSNPKGYHFKRCECPSGSRDLEHLWGNISSVVAAALPSTVLAQDHFYSDFCGLPLTFQTQA